MASLPSGVKLNLVSKNLLDPMASAERIRFVLDEVQAGKVLVLEHGLTPQEEAQLIEATMGKIEPDGFTGIEMQSYGRPEPVTRWKKILRSATRPRMVVIGPANLLRMVTKDALSLETIIVPPGSGA